MGLEILDVMFRGICVGVAASITVGPVAVLCIQRTCGRSGCRRCSGACAPEQLLLY